MASTEQKNEFSKVIAFDSWTSGKIHFISLANEFAKRGYQLVLIHIGSWGHDPNRPKEERFGELLCRDITYYGSRDFQSILEMEAPKAVIFLSTRSFAHQAFNRLANHRKIPTCHLYHGLVTVQAVAPGESPYKTNIRQQAGRILSRIQKNTGRLIPCYLRSLHQTSAKPSEYLAIFRMLFAKALGIYETSYVQDTQTTIGCVYVHGDVGHMQRNYRISPTEIHVVGNPDLAKFELKQEDLGCLLSQDRAERRIIVYIDTALSKSGYVFKDDDDFISHLEDTNRQITSHGYQMTVKLHPAHKGSKVPQALERLGIATCTDEQFVKTLKTAAAVITEPSSAAITPALLGQRLLLTNYGKLSDQRFGELLTSYPLAFALTDLRNLPELINVDTCKHEKSIRDWIFSNCGPLPSCEVPKRIVDAVLDTIGDM
jgi:hypothetical protein